MPNEYIVTGKHTTSGLSTIGDDINASNRFNQSPIHVACSVGNVSELKHILSQPNVNSKLVSHNGRQWPPEKYVHYLYQEEAKGDPATVKTLYEMLTHAGNGNTAAMIETADKHLGINQPTGQPMKPSAQAKSRAPGLSL